MNMEGGMVNVQELIERFWSIIGSVTFVIPNIALQLSSREQT